MNLLNNYCHATQQTLTDDQEKKKADVMTENKNP